MRRILSIYTQLCSNSKDVRENAEQVIRMLWIGNRMLKGD